MKKSEPGISRLVVGGAVALFILLLLIMIPACAATYQLPDYHPAIPAKPILEEMPDEELSEEAYRNIVNLMAYAEAQNEVLLEWQRYYDYLRNLK